MSMKLYTLDEPIASWILNHRDEIYFDILEQCEIKLLMQEDDCHIEVAMLKTKEGITKFVIKDILGILESLEKAMKYFVEVEKYELAARARDCINSWKIIEINNTCQ